MFLFADNPNLNMCLYLRKTATALIYPKEKKRKFARSYQLYFNSSSTVAEFWQWVLFLPSTTCWPKDSTKPLNYNLPMVIYSICLSCVHISLITGISINHITINQKIHLACFCCIILKQIFGV